MHTVGSEPGVVKQSTQVWLPSSSSVGAEGLKSGGCSPVTLVLHTATREALPRNPFVAYVAPITVSYISYSNAQVVKQNAKHSIFMAS
jgi:hypothetical protein